MRKALTVLLLGLANLAYAQESCKLVVDASDRKPIPYATVYGTSASWGLYTSDEGTSCVDTSTMQADSVVVSSLGYKPFKVPYSTFLSLDTIHLSASPLLLEEVVVKADGRRLKSRRIGYFSRALIEMRSFGFAHNSNVTLATYINSDEVPSPFIAKVFCRLTPKKNDLVRTFRLALRLYGHDELRELPGDDLLDELIIENIAPDQKTVEFKVESKGLKVPADGFWIGVSCVGYTDYQGNYHPIQDRTFGRFTLKDYKKMKVKDVERIAPMYAFTIDNKGLIYKSVTSTWNGKWVPRKEKENMVFCFGAEVVW